MSYAVVNPAIVPLQPGEVQVTLDTGQTIAVSYSAVPSSGNGKAIIANARQVDSSTGNTVDDPLGHPIQSSAQHVWAASDIQQFTGDACIKDVMLVVLGETPLLKYGNGQYAISQDGQILASWSIRTSIANAASITQTAPASIL